MARKISYTFETEGQKPWNYVLNFDDNHHLVPRPTEETRNWTKLEYHQCPHCPLKKSESPHCPVALNLDQVVENFKNVLSFTKSKVTVEAPERTYIKTCAAQDGLKALFGLIMACSGCPYLDWLKPLARFHLPFAELDETLFRALSLQLLEDFLNDELTNPAQTSQKLRERYQKVETINHAFAERIRSYCQEDADKNAIASLDVYVQMFDIHMQGNFEALRVHFAPSKKK